MILVCFGTRPEYIKIKPLLDVFDGVVDYKILFTGQHEDLLDGVHADQKLQIIDGENRLDSITSSVMNSIDFKGIDQVLVQGDTATAFAIALSAFHHRIPIIHLEAGMRTFDTNNPYPEEFYRQAISRVADIHLAPSQIEKDNLIYENQSDKNIHVVGNTVLDNLKDVSISYNKRVLVTLHRRENHHQIAEYFKRLSQIAEENSDLEFVIPLHPNPNVQKHRNLLKNIKVIDPLPYDEMIQEIARCRFIISDSGGIQEEASFLHKKVIVCREKTERVSTVGLNCFLCSHPSKLNDMVRSIRDNYIVYSDCPYGDGHASEKILEILK